MREALLGKNNSILYAKASTYWLYALRREGMRRFWVGPSSSGIRQAEGLSAFDVAAKTRCATKTLNKYYKVFWGQNLLSFK